MKKWFFFILIVYFLIPINAFAIDLDLYSKRYLLFNLDTGEVLLEKDASEPISIASMTKIMTGIVSLEYIRDLDEKVTLVSSDFKGLAEAGASMAGFQVGDQVTYRDLLYGLLLPSGAESAQALVRLTAGNRKAFVKRMNETAKKVGLHNTHYQNETGLDTEGHYSSAFDLAKLFMYGLKNPDFKKIVTTQKYTATNGLRMQGTAFRNIDRYSLTMDYLLGGKTGTTYDAGLCMTSIASYDGVNYLLVTAGAPFPNTLPYHLLDAETIYEYFMEHYGNEVIVPKGRGLLTLPTKDSFLKEVVIKSDKDFVHYMNKDFEEDKITFSYQGKESVSPFNPIGTHLGTLEIFYGGEFLTTEELYLQERVPFSIFVFLSSHIKEVLLLTLVFVFYRYYHKVQKKKRKHVSRKVRV